MANSNFTSTNEEVINSTDTTVSETDEIDVMKLIHSLIASVGIVTNLTVVVVFLNHKKLRQKIPNICIINQVSCFIFVFR